MSTSTTAMAKTDLDARVDVAQRPPELRRLAVTFNDMAGRLQSVSRSARSSPTPPISCAFR